MTNTRTGSDHALAPEIEGVIARVVRRARLRRGEREDVARELRTHFSAGLAEGKSAAEVVGEFGDVKAAGKMIGRAKRRCRGVVWQAWVWSVRGVMGLFALVVVMYGWAAWCYYGASPTITRNYLKEINDPIRALDPSECALPEYEAVYWGLSAGDRQRISDCLFAKPDDAAWPDREWAVVRMAPELASVRAASGLPHFGYVLVGGGAEVPSDGPVFEWSRRMGTKEADGQATLVEVLLPALTTARFVMRALDADGRQAVSVGDADRFVGDVEAILGIARQQAEVPLAICHLVAISEGMRAAAMVREAVADYPDVLTGAQLRSVAHALGTFEARFARVPLEGERDAMLDGIQRCFSPGPFGMSLMNKRAVEFTGLLASDDALGLGRLDPIVGMVARPGAALTTATRAESERFVDMVMDCAARDSAKRPWEVETFEFNDYFEAMDRSEIRRWRFWFVRTWLMAMDKVITRTWRFRSEVDATMAVIGAECFRREQGRWPMSWGELVPSYLSEVPLDMFDGKPVRMGMRDGQWFIYSIGVDRKDDGGRIAVSREGRIQLVRPATWMSREELAALPANEVQAFDGDWILWPLVDEQTGEFVVGERAE